MVTRQILASFPSASEAAGFVEYVQSVVRGVRLIAVVKGSRVKLVLEGGPEEVEEALQMVRRCLGEWKSSHRARAGLFLHPIKLVLTKAKLSTAIPVKCLCDVLSLRGRRARLTGAFIECDVGLDDVIKIAEEFSENYRDALKLDAYPLVKRLAAVVATAYGLDVSEALVKLMALELVRDEGGRLVMATQYERALEKLKSEHVGGG